MIDNITTQRALIRTLRGSTATFGSFNGGDFDETEFERHLSTNGMAIAACWDCTRKLQARFFAGDYPAAVEASLQAQQMLWASPAFIEMAEAHFYGALSHAASYDASGPGQYDAHGQALAAHRNQLAIWAEICPENFENRALLVDAEIARIERRELDAERLYDAAIRSARENEFVQNEALANELAARFYAGRGFEKIARAYLRDARDGYRQWGADGKVRQLEAQYPYLIDDNRSSDSARTVQTPVEQLDLSTVLQVSRAVQGETDLDTLIETVMRLSLEHAGAERGLLILPQGNDSRIEAEARSSEDRVTVDLRHRSVGVRDLPQPILQYIQRTRERVIVQDASRANELADDEYVRRRGVRSVLCIPLLKQSRLVGILYLENSLTSGAFTPARVALLEVLASDAAISLENARLYRDLQERETRVRRLIDANIIGIFIWHADGRVFDANDEFLHIIGHDREELIAGRLRWTDFTLPENRPRDLRILEDLKAGGEVKATERGLLRKDGTRVSVLTGGTMFEGVPNEGVAFIVDLTEQRRAEEALRERERESHLILDTIPGLVATLNSSGEVDAVNQELVAFCGQPLEVMKAWGTNGTVHPDDLPHMGPIFSKAIASGEPYDLESRIRRFYEVYRWLQVRGSASRFHRADRPVVRATR